MCAFTVLAWSAAITNPSAIARPAQSRLAHHHRHGKRVAVAASATGTSVLFGDTTIDPTTDSNPRGVAEAFPFVGAQSGTTSTVSVYVGSGSSASRLSVGLYSQANGRPASLLTTGSAPAPTAGTWTTVAVSPAPVTAGATYWLAVLGTGGTLVFKDRSGRACRSFTSSAQNLTSPPASWSSSSQWASCPLSAYGNGSTTSTPPAPVNTAAPAISGGTVSGDTLSVSSGGWNPAPSAYAYAWQQCDAGAAHCVTVSGATATTYTLGAGDVGRSLRALVTATNMSGSTSMPSAATAMVTSPPPPPPPPVAAPVNTVAPTVSGGSAVGQTVTTSAGSWSNGPTSRAYQWQDCDGQGANCAAIAGATASSYTLAADDAGHTVRAIVIATNAAGSTAAASGQTPVVTAPVGSGCTTTVTSMSSLSAAVQSATGGSTICVAPGSYTGMQLSGTHSSDVTIEPEPNLDPAGSGKVTIGLSSTVTDGFGNLVAADVAPNTSHVVIHNFYFTGELSIAHGSSDVTVSNNDMTEVGPTGGGEYINFATSDCTAPNSPSWPNCSPLAPVSNVTISGNDFHDNNQTTNGGDDVLHTNNFRNLTITGNQFRNIVENNAGGHVDCLQNVFGGTGLVFDHNYMHDNECQGFFIKDGDITNVTFDENLFLRDNLPATNGGSSYSLSQAWNTSGLVAEHNTVWDSKGLGLRCMTSTVPCTATIDHNLLSMVNNGSTGDSTRYSLADSANVFATNPWTFATSSTDVVNANPAFVCGSSCANGTAAGDDYRLASNPNGVGVDWAPSQQTYGPVRL